MEFLPECMNAWEDVEYEWFCNFPPINFNGEKVLGNVEYFRKYEGYE